MMQLSPAHLHIIREILKKYPYTFYLFGSRAKGNAKHLSSALFSRSRRLETLLPRFQKPH
jgi:hypothetical protein